MARATCIFRARFCASWRANYCGGDPVRQGNLRVRANCGGWHGPLHSVDGSYGKHVHQPQAAREIRGGVDGSDQHSDCARNGDSGGPVHSCESLSNDRGEAGEGQLLLGRACYNSSVRSSHRGREVNMEALKFLALNVGIGVAVAGAFQFLVGLALAPLERMRLRWLEREREAEAAKAVRV